MNQKDSVLEDIRSWKEMIQQIKWIQSNAMPVLGRPAKTHDRWRVDRLDVGRTPMLTSALSAAWYRFHILCMNIKFVRAKTWTGIPSQDAHRRALISSRTAQTLISSSFEIGSNLIELFFAAVMAAVESGQDWRWAKTTVGQSGG